MPLPSCPGNTASADRRPPPPSRPGNTAGVVALVAMAPSTTTLMDEAGGRRRRQRRCVGPSLPLGVRGVVCANTSFDITLSTIACNLLQYTFCVEYYIRLHKSVFEHTKVYCNTLLCVRTHLNCSNTHKCVRLSGARLSSSFGRKLVQRRYIHSSMSG